MASVTLDPSKTVVLLGAGASADAGLPLSGQLFASTIDLVRDYSTREEAIALNFAVGTLANALGISGSDPTRVDIEQLVTLIDDMSERRSRPEASFVPWPPLLTDRGESVDVARVFRGLAEKMVEMVARCIEGATDAGKGGYLKPLLRSGVRTIATLNFDCLLEQVAAETAGVDVSTGIDRWHETGQLDFGPAPLRLLKLHGSVGWNLTLARAPDGVRTAASFVWPSTIRTAPHLPATVLGTRGKLRADGPYLELFDEFRRALWQGDTLVVVGYSFRDEHVNTLLLRWRNHASRKMVIVTLNPAPAGELQAFTRLGVPIVEKTAAAAFLDLFPAV